MTARLGDGPEQKAVTLGGGPPSDDDPDSIGPKGSLFIGLRHARHEATLLAVSAPSPVLSGPSGPVQSGEGAGGADGGPGGIGGGGDAGDGDGGGDGGDS